jgi:hypothetical protein
MADLRLPPGQGPILTAAADYSVTGQYRAVIQTNQTAVLCSALGQRPIGILKNNPYSGETAEIATMGEIFPAYYGGTVAVGDRLVTDANGALINAALVGAGATAAAYPIAVALYAGVSGDRHAVQILPPPVEANGVEYWNFPLSLIIAASGDLMTAWVPGFAGRIVSLSWTTQIVGAGVGASITMNAEIGTTDVTGGVVTITLATTTPAGTRIAGTAVTAANAFTAADSISLETVVGTAFSAGSGFLTVGYVRG